MSETRFARTPLSVRTVSEKSFTNGTIGLITTISFAPASHRDVEVRRRHQSAVDQLALADRDRRVDHRQRPRRAHGRGDRHVAILALAPNTTRSHVSRSVAVRYSSRAQLAEVVAAAGLAEHAAQVGLDARARVGAGGQALGEARAARPSATPARAGGPPAAPSPARATAAARPCARARPGSGAAGRRGRRPRTATAPGG